MLGMVGSFLTLLEIEDLVDLHGCSGPECFLASEAHVGNTQSGCYASLLGSLLFCLDASEPSKGGGFPFP
jgi:hypothetical protein